MSDRKTIRPLVQTQSGTSNPAEQFQNETLRPILKMQNELLLAVYRHFLAKRRVPFAKKTEKEQAGWIRHSLQQDNRLRSTLLGLVIGQFTLAEWETYTQQEAECRRRLTQPLARRLTDQLDKLSGG